MRGVIPPTNIILLASHADQSTAASAVSQMFNEEQQQILRLTTPRLKSTPGAPFAQDDSSSCGDF
jgi:hypothetical protein